MHISQLTLTAIIVMIMSVYGMFMPILLKLNSDAKRMIKANVWDIIICASTGALIVSIVVCSLSLVYDKFYLQ